MDYGFFIMSSLKTPLHSLHIEAGAAMVNFHGWEMPLHYGSQIAEHQVVRHDAGLFDVSHMTVVEILGPGSRQFLRKLLITDVDKLQHSGLALYSCMCNEHGGIIDDLIVYQLTADHYRLVLNSATRTQDLEWIGEQIKGFNVGLQEAHELAIIACQGPNAIQKTLSVLNPKQTDSLATLVRFECVEVDGLFFARTGYTGEDGLEIILPSHLAPDLWRKLCAANIKPCGLGARDTLRLEAGLLLYGQDMDIHTTPLESALNTMISWDPLDRHFIGMGALLSQKQFGAPRKLIGLTLKEKAIMRHGQRVFVNNAPVGTITSGSFSPTLGHSIALARIPNAPIDTIHVEIRNKLYAANIDLVRFFKSPTIPKL